MKKQANNLIHSNSPYLLQHAYNPVDWLSYDSSLINKADNQKLLIISIGYSACHWCHVMEHESFEDLEVAELMNQSFINIKIDREEHPQIDKIYMHACRLMTGGGGWPLNVVCTPDGIPIHAGTYFPKAQWMSMLNTIQKLWDESPEQISTFKTKLNEVLVNDNLRSALDIKVNQVLEAIDKNTNLLDYNKGGLMGSPKFPMPVLLGNLLNWSKVFGNDNLEQFVNLTLLKMMKGGMWDLIEGGFSRYSVDENWFVPHFEKMLYDNAQLLPLYLTVGHKIRLPILSQVGEAIVSFCNAELKQDNGLYAGALDADTSEGEGVYYSVTEEEYRSALNSKELEFCKTYMGFSKEGNWEKGLNIPVLNAPPQQIINELSITEQELNDLVESIFRHFRFLRTSKEKPSLDYKCLCAWNGLMLGGLAKSAIYTNSYLKEAEALAKNMEQFETKSSLYHQISKGEKELVATLDDFAFYIEGLLDLFVANSNEEYVMKALSLTEQALAHHLRDNRTLLFQNKAEDLFTEVPDWEDNVVPSAIGTMCSNLLRLGALFGNIRFEEVAKEHIVKNQEAILNHTFWHAQWLSLWTQMKAGNPIVVCSSNTAKINLLAEVSDYLPDTLLTISAEESKLSICEGKSSKENQYFICLNQNCLAPLDEPGKVLEVIRDHYGYV